MPQNLDSSKLISSTPAGSSRTHFGSSSTQEPYGGISGARSGPGGSGCLMVQGGSNGGAQGGFGSLGNSEDNSQPLPPSSAGEDGYLGKGQLRILLQCSPKTDEDNIHLVLSNSMNYQVPFT